MWGLIEFIEENSDWIYVKEVPMTLMKPNESAKEHPVSFVGNQIRGNT